MENASKALLMAASVLIGLLLLSLGIYLVNSIKTFSTGYKEDIDSYKRQQFNAPFTSISNRKNISIHEIITLKNYADEFNFSNNVEKGNSQYIKVILVFKNNTINLTDEKTYPHEYKNNPDKFISDLLDGTYVNSLYKMDTGFEKEGQYQYEYIYDESNPTDGRKKIGKKYYNCYECKGTDYVVSQNTGIVSSIKFNFQKSYEELSTNRN